MKKYKGLLEKLYYSTEEWAKARQKASNKKPRKKFYGLIPNPLACLWVKYPNQLQIKNMINRREKMTNINVEFNVKILNDDDLIKLRDDVSNEIIARNYEKTSDGMLCFNAESASKFLSFDMFTLNQCLTIAETLLKTIKEKQGNNDEN